MNSDVVMVDAFLKRGNVITKMTAVTVVMRRVVSIHLALMVNSHAPIINAFLNHNSATVSTTAKTIRHQMKTMLIVRTTELVQAIISSAKIRIYVSSLIGYATVITIVAITRMRMRSFAHNEPVRRTVSDAQKVIDASQLLGIVMVTMTVATDLTNPKNIARAKSEHVLVICLHAITATAFRVSTFAMVTMTA